MNKGYYFAYSPNLYKFLRDNGARYIATGLNENTHRQFWLYERNAKLSDLLTQYQVNKPA
jgi:hypothetical protein